MAEVRNIGAVITLNDAEQAIARYIGRRRNKANQTNHIQNKRVSSQSDENINVEGFAAEMACCKLFNVYPDFVIGPRSGGHDFEHFGVRFDVKGTDYPDAHLIAKIGKHLGDADIYVLMIGVFPTYTFKGCAHASELLIPARIKELKPDRPTYAIPQSDLYTLCPRHGPFVGETCPQCEEEKECDP
jgi:hypothetical protein